MSETSEGVDPGAVPSGTGCAECLATGGWWVHLRRCAKCGHSWHQPGEAPEQDDIIVQRDIVSDFDAILLGIDNHAAAKFDPLSELYAAVFPHNRRAARDSRLPCDLKDAARKNRLQPEEVRQTYLSQLRNLLFRRA